MDIKSNRAVIAGGRRIRQKKRAQSHTTGKNESFYLKSMDACNKKILAMNDRDYLKFRDYSTKVINEATEEIKRDHFKNRDEYRKYKENKLKYLYTVLLCPKDNVKIIFKKDNFKFIDSTFHREGLVIIDKLIKLLENSIVEKKYESNDPDQKYNKEEFNECCKVLGIETTNKVTFTEIKNGYNVKKEYAGGNSEEKEKINKAFITIRNQYEDYLNNN